MVSTPNGDLWSLIQQSELRRWYVNYPCEPYKFGTQTASWATVHSTDEPSVETTNEGRAVQGRKEVGVPCCCTVLIRRCNGRGLYSKSYPAILVLRGYVPDVGYFGLGPSL